MTEFQPQKKPERAPGSTSFSSSNSSDSGAGGTGGSSSSSSSGFNFSQLIVPGAALLLLLGIVQGLSRAFQPKNARLNLKEVELNPTAQSQKMMQTEAPRYGLDDVVVEDDPVYIILRDNGAEDGDFVTLHVNGQAYNSSLFLRNAGNTIKVPLNPGPNLVQIRGDRDGGGGITVAADVSSQGNMTSTPIPVGGTAMFYIIRK